MEGGHSIADILFGQVSPSANLPCTFPQSADQLSFFDKDAETIEYGFFHARSALVGFLLSSPFSFSFPLNFSSVRPFALWSAFTDCPGWSLLHRLLRPRLTSASPSDRPPRIRCDCFPLILAAFTQSCFDPFWTSLSLASSSRTPRLFTQFLSIQSRFCSPASSPHSLTLMQLPSAGGSSGQRPQWSFTS